MQVSGAGIAGPGEVSAAASFAARMASICNAAKPAKSAPVGLPSEPRKPESTSLPMDTRSGIVPACRYDRISAVWHCSCLPIRQDFGFHVAVQVRLQLVELGVVGPSGRDTELDQLQSDLY